MTPLDQIRRQRQNRDEAQEWMEKHIRYAHKCGISLRAIAEAAGMSHESVRRLIRTDQASGS